MSNKVLVDFMNECLDNFKDGGSLLRNDDPIIGGVRPCGETIGTAAPSDEMSPLFKWCWDHKQ